MARGRASDGVQKLWTADAQSFCSSTAAFVHCCVSKLGRSVSISSQEAKKAFAGAEDGAGSARWGAVCLHLALYLLATLGTLMPLIRALSGLHELYVAYEGNLQAENADEILARSSALSAL